MKIKSGGGIQSNKLVTSTNYTNKASPAGAGQLGTAVQFRKEPLIQQGKGYQSGPQQTTGIAGAYKGSAGAAPGGMGRTIFPSGSQSKTPPANPPAKGRDILSEYGPERKI